MRLQPVFLAFLLALTLAGAGWADDVVLSPAPGETVRQARPVITVQLPTGGTIPYAGARMWVNEREVTALTLRTPLFVSYQPPLEMQAGPVEVRFQARRQDGTPVERQWSFQLQPEGRIRSVTHDARAELGEYEDLTVEMQAEPGGRAWFEVEGLCPRVPMEEVSEGLYRGTYQVQTGDYKMAGRVVGHLEFGPRRYSLEAPEPVNVFGHLFRVRILEPENGTQVPLGFDITGQTRPHARISIVPKLGFQEGLAAPTRNDPAGNVGAIPAEADENGFFTARYGVPLKLPNMHLILTVTATDEEGNRSIPTILRLRF